jgi:hypothetical protein
MTTDDKKISSLYRQGKKQVPPKHLDDAILNAAHAVVSEEKNGVLNDQTTLSRLVIVKGPFSGGWPASVVIAAVLIITVILVPVINREVPPERSRLADRPFELLQEQETITRTNAYQEDPGIEAEINARAKADTSSMKQGRRLSQVPQDSLDSQLLKPGKTEQAKQITSDASRSAMGAAVQTTLPERSEVPAAASLKAIEFKKYAQKPAAEKEQRASGLIATYEKFSDVLTPKEWLKNIQQLIDHGEFDLAKQELDEFNKLYPDEEIDSLILKRLKER